MYHDTVCKIRYAQDMSMPSGVNISEIRRCVMQEKILV